MRWNERRLWLTCPWWLSCSDNRPLKKVVLHRTGLWSQVRISRIQAAHVNVEESFFSSSPEQKKGKKGPVRLPAITWRCAHVAHIFNIPARNHFFLSSCCCFCCLNFFCAGANWIWNTHCLLRFKILLMPLVVVMTRALKHFTGHNDVSVIRKPLSFITIYQVDPGGIRNKVLRIEGRLWYSDHATREWWLHMFFNQENKKATLPSLEKNYLYDWL